MQAASAIPTHIEAQIAPRLTPRRLSASPEGVHSSSRLRVNSKRSTVREIASRLASASCGKQATVNASCCTRRPPPRSICTTCDQGSTAVGLNTSSSSHAMRVGSTMIVSTARVQTEAGASTVQPSSSSAVKAIGSRLRRRLSSNFQRDRLDKGLVTRRPSAAGTPGSNQRISCQSPRVQRWRRVASAR